LKNELNSAKVNLAPKFSDSELQKSEALAYLFADRVEAEHNGALREGAQL
jgi:hypothetical protein